VTADTASARLPLSRRDPPRHAPKAFADPPRVPLNPTETTDATEIHR
jgi:hypothetical protein